MSRILQVGDRVELSAKGRYVSYYHGREDRRGTFLGRRPRVWWQSDSVEIQWDGEDRISNTYRSYIKKVHIIPDIEDFL